MHTTITYVLNKAPITQLHMYIIHLYEYLRLHNAVDRLLDVGLVDVGLGQLLVPVGGQPDAGQRALLGQHEVGVEHAAAAVVLVVDGDKNSCNKEFCFFSRCCWRQNCRYRRRVI